MNDKLRLYIPRENYKKNNNFDNNFVKNTCIKPNIETGQKEQIDSSYLNKEESMSIDINRGSKNNDGLLLTFNMDKRLHIPFGAIIEHKQFIEEIEAVEEEMSSYGIDCKLIDSQISRVDTSFDIKTLNPYSQYNPLIQTLAPFGIRQAGTKIIANSFYYGNGLEESIVYDKTAEYNKTAEVKMTDNYMRFENRILVARKKRNFERNLRPYINDEDRYHAYRQAEKRKIEQRFFDKNPKILSDKAEIIGIVWELMNNGISNNNIYKSVAIQTINEALKINNITSDVFKFDRKSGKYYRSRNFRKDLKSELYVPENLIELYEELRTLFKKVA